MLMAIVMEKDNKSCIEEENLRLGAFLRVCA